MVHIIKAFLDLYEDYSCHTANFKSFVNDLGHFAELLLCWMTLSKSGLLNYDYVIGVYKIVQVIEKHYLLDFENKKKSKEVNYLLDFKNKKKSKEAPRFCRGMIKTFFQLSIKILRISMRLIRKTMQIISV